MKPLVSILISAYNAEDTLGETLGSAVGQSWPNKEIIVVDDGSHDATAVVARRFAGRGVKVISRKNGGLSAGINTAYQESRGDYIQFLDADDLLAPDKIEKQVAALRNGDSPRLLLSSPWALFYHRTRSARFVNNSLCADLSPVEWLLRKMSEACHMQNATWLVSRTLTEAAGPWDTQLHYDQDGEYFARVLLASEGVRFVPGTGIYYRSSGLHRISYIGNSQQKKQSLLRSMKLHLRYLRSLEESERVRKASLDYLQNWFEPFCFESPEMVAELQSMAAELGGHLEHPRLRGKYGWMAAIVGRERALRAQSTLPQLKAVFLRAYDKALHRLETAKQS